MNFKKCSGGMPQRLLKYVMRSRLSTSKIAFLTLNLNVTEHTQL